MKILYIEDDIKVLSPLIPEIFGNFMTDEEKIRFKEIQKDDYMGSPEIKELFRDSSVLNVEYDFLEALSLITSDKIKQYDYFVFDRNLGVVNKGLTLEEVKSVFSSFSQDELNYIKNNGEYGREGDYLLSILREQFGVEADKLRGKVYFLSTYPSRDVFNNNHILRQLTSDNILTKEQYIDKNRPEDKLKLKKIIENDDKEGVELQKKWNGVLAYYNRFDKGHEIEQTLIAALKSSLMDSQESCLSLIHDIKQYYGKLFQKKIKEQLKKYNTERDTFTQGKKIRDEDIHEWDDKWYAKAEIPKNIIDIGNIIRLSRNVCEHKDDKDGNINISCFTVLCCAYALLEVTRFWQEKGWK